MHQSAASSVSAGTSPSETPGRVDPPVPRRRKRKWRRYIFLSLGLLLLLGVIAGVVASKREKPIEVTTEQAARRTIVELVSATGKVQPETEVKISPEVAGEIIELPVSDGAPVKKGDLLVRIKPDSYKALLEQQEAAISGSRATNLQQKASLTKAEADFKRSEDLFNKRMISDQEFATTRAAVEVARATFESSLHDIEKAEASSSQARDQLSKTTIYTPINGVVTVLNSKLGERVVATNQFAGTEVMRVADLSRMQGVVDVNENDVVNVKVGDDARVTVDAYGERRFSGKVAQIANTGKTTGSGTQEEVTNFEVKINLDTQGVLLRPGLSCTAEIQTNMIADVVSIPLQSVTIRTGDPNLSPEEIDRRKEKQQAEDKGNSAADVTNLQQEKKTQREEREKIAKVVFLKKGATARQVKVTTGISDDTYIEVKSGVSPGDEVISGSYSAISRKLKDNAKVTLEKQKK
ncbi:MAG: efflux RND transporter periplasmic adaptor subunit [Verrucomicrobiota bacterium]